MNLLDRFIRTYCIKSLWSRKHIAFSLQVRALRGQMDDEMEKRSQVQGEAKSQAQIISQLKAKEKHLKQVKDGWIRKLRSILCIPCIFNVGCG